MTSTAKCQIYNKAGVLYDALLIERIDSVDNLDQPLKNNVYVIDAINTNSTHYRIYIHMDKSVDLVGKSKLEVGQWYILPLESIFQGPISRTGGQFLVAPGISMTGTLYYDNSVVIEPDKGIYDLYTSRKLNGVYFSSGEIRPFLFGKKSDNTTETNDTMSCSLFSKDIKDLCEHSGGKCRKVEYKYSKDYLKHNPNCYAAHVINYVTPIRREQCTISGELYIIPNEKAKMIVTDVTTTIKKYLNDYPTEACYFLDGEKDYSLSRLLYSDSSHEESSDSSSLRSYIFLERIEDGRLAVLFLKTDDDLVVPSEYWNIESVNDDKRILSFEQPCNLGIATYYESDEIFEGVQESPKFPGEENALSAYINSTMKLPTSAIFGDVQALVKLCFVIEKDGSVSNVETVKFENYFGGRKSKKHHKKAGKVTEKELANINAELKAEAERIIKEMPRWAPGKKGGKIVRTRISLKIKLFP